jgi:hypothetical protein
LPELTPEFLCMLYPSGLYAFRGNMHV